MAKLLMPREAVQRALKVRIRAGKDLEAKAEIAENAAGYRDWLSLLATWREETIAELEAMYEGADIQWEFAAMTGTSERSSPQYTFPYAKTHLEYGIMTLRRLIERLDLAAAESPDSTAIESLHPEILSRCRKLFESGSYAEAVEKSFKVVRDRSRCSQSLSGNQLQIPYVYCGEVDFWRRSSS